MLSLHLHSFNVQDVVRVLRTYYLPDLLSPTLSTPIIQPGPDAANAAKAVNLCKLSRGCVQVLNYFDRHPDSSLFDGIDEIYVYTGDPFYVDVKRSSVASVSSYVTIKPKLSTELCKFFLLHLCLTHLKDNYGQLYQVEKQAVAQLITLNLSIMAFIKSYDANIKHEPLSDVDVSVDQYVPWIQKVKKKAVAAETRIETLKIAYYSFTLINLCKEMLQLHRNRPIKRRIRRLLQCVDDELQSMTENTFITKLQNINTVMFACFVVLDVFVNKKLFELLDSELAQKEQELEELSNVKESLWGQKQDLHVFLDMKGNVVTNCDTLRELLTSIVQNLQYLVYSPKLQTLEAWKDINEALDVFLVPDRGVVHVMEEAFQSAIAYSREHNVNVERFESELQRFTKKKQDTVSTGMKRACIGAFCVGALMVTGSMVTPLTKSVNAVNVTNATNPFKLPNVTIPFTNTSAAPPSGEAATAPPSTVPPSGEATTAPPSTVPPSGEAAPTRFWTSSKRAEIKQKAKETFAAKEAARAASRKAARDASLMKAKQQAYLEEATTFKPSSLRLLKDVSSSKPLAQVPQSGIKDLVIEDLPYE